MGINLVIGSSSKHLGGGGGGLLSGEYGISIIVQLVGIRFGCWIQIDIAN